MLLLCEDEAKAMSVVRAGLLIVCVCVWKCLSWVISGAGSAYVVFIMCKPLNYVNSGLHCLTFLLTWSCFSQCLFGLRVWVSRMMGIQVLFSVSLVPILSHSFPPCHSVSVWGSSLFSLCLLSCVSSYSHFALLFCHKTYILFFLTLYLHACNRDWSG